MKGPLYWEWLGMAWLSAGSTKALFRPMMVGRFLLKYITDLLAFLGRAARTMMAWRASLKWPKCSRVSPLLCPRPPGHQNAICEQSQPPFRFATSKKCQSQQQIQHASGDGWLGWQTPTPMLAPTRPEALTNSAHEGLTTSNIYPLIA